MSLLFDVVYVSFLILHSSPLSPQVLHFLPSCVHAYLTYTCPPVLPTSGITCSTGALLAVCIYDLLPLLLCHSVVVSLLLHCTLITAVFYINYFYSYLFGFYLLKSPRWPPPPPLYSRDHCSDFEHHCCSIYVYFPFLSVWFEGLIIVCLYLD